MLKFSNLGEMFNFLKALAVSTLVRSSTFITKDLYLSTVLKNLFGTVASLSPNLEYNSEASIALFFLMDISVQTRT